MSCKDSIALHRFVRMARSEGVKFNNYKKKQAKTMKKIILAVSIVLLCAACGGDGSSSDPVQPNPSTEQKAAEVTIDDIVKFLNLDKQ